MQEATSKDNLPNPTPGKVLLVIGFSLMLGIGAGTLLYGLQQRQNTINDINIIVHKQSQKLQLLSIMKSSARERSLCLFNMVSREDPFERDDWFLKFNSHGARFASARLKLISLSNIPQEKEFLKIQGERSAKAIPIQHDIVDLVQSHKIREAKKLLITGGIPLQNKVFDIIDQYQIFLAENINQRIATINRNHENALIVLMILGLGSFLIGLFLAIHVIRNTTRIAKLNFVEKKLAQVTLSSIGDAVITTNAYGHIQFMNKEAVKMTGWSNSESTNKPILDVMCIIDNKTTKPLTNPVTQAIATRESIISDEHSALIDRNKNRFDIEYKASAILDSDNKNFGGVVVFRDVTETRALAKQLSHQASHDELTGLVNRREFEIRVNQAINNAKVEPRQYALLYLDLDQFKIINDMGGHNAGDELLKQISIIIHQILRESDTLARLGGDEFGILLDGCPIAKASEIAESIRVAIDKFSFYWDDKVFDIGVSIGVIMINAESGSLADIMSAVDTACYTAKDLGRNRIQLYQQSNNELNKRKTEMYWSQRISKAINEDDFQLYAQEILPVNNKQPSRKIYEILLRLKDNENHIITPHVFLPAAERFSLTSAIDKWVISKTFQTISSYKLNEDKFKFSINLSGQSLNTHDMLSFIINSMEETSVPAEMIQFEITESMAIANLSTARKFISVLTGLGCDFALDDFGKGLSSFTYLKHIPVQTIKIDGSFIRDILNDKISITFVNSINDIAHAMDLKTTAEYVENEAIYNEIIKLNVDFVQGNFISPAIPLHTILNNKLDSS